MGIRFYQNAAYPSGTDTLLHTIGAHNGPGDHHFYLADLTNTYANANRYVTVEHNGAPFVGFYINPVGDFAQSLFGPGSGGTGYSTIPNWENWNVIVGGKFAITDTLLAAGKVKFSGLSTTAQAYVAMMDADGNMFRVDTADFDGGGGGGSYTDEEAQDAIGAMVDGTLTYTDATPVLKINLGNANTWTADQSVPDEAYDATNWNGSLEVPTKNAVRDKIESLTSVNIYNTDGTLTGNRTLTNNNNQLTFSNSGYGSNVSLQLLYDDPNTNLRRPILNIRQTTTGTPAAGIGGAIQWLTEDLSTVVESGWFVNKWSNVTHASRTSEFDMIGIDNATEKVFANFQTGGIVRVNNLADTLATKAYARSVISGLTTVSFGTNKQIPYTNSGGTDYDYSSAFTFDGSTLNVGGAAEFNSGNSSSGDVIIKGLTDNNLLWTDASQDEVYIGTATDAGAYKLQIGENVWLSASKAIYIGNSGSYITSNCCGDVGVSGNNSFGIQLAGSVYKPFYVTTGGIFITGGSFPTLRAASAKLELEGGTATAGTASLKVASGTLLSTTEAGALENDGAHLYFTFANAGTRYQLDQQGGSSSVATLTDVTLTGLASGDFLKYNGSAWINRTAANVRTDLSLVPGTDVQAYDGDLATIAGLTATTDNFLVSVSSAWASRTPAQVKTTLALNNVDNTSDATKNSATATLTNKRVTKRTGTTTSSATPTINTDNVDEYYITAQTVDITSFTTNLSGTPSLGDKLVIHITGTASRAITWGASFSASTIALPTTTSGTATLSVIFDRNDANNSWRVAGVW
jgi:hypothetical protein